MKTSLTPFSSSFLFFSSLGLLFQVCLFVLFWIFFFLTVLLCRPGWSGKPTILPLKYLSFLSIWPFKTRLKTLWFKGSPCLERLLESAGEVDWFKEEKGWPGFYKNCPVFLPVGGREGTQVCISLSPVPGVPGSSRSSLRGAVTMHTYRGDWKSFAFTASPV